MHSGLWQATEYVMTICTLYYFSIAFYIRLQSFIVTHSTTHIPSSQYSTVTFQRSYSAALLPTNNCFRFFPHTALLSIVTYDWFSGAAPPSIADYMYILGTCIPAFKRLQTDALAPKATGISPKSLFVINLTSTDTIVI
jgi:hypothetical protein